MVSTGNRIFRKNRSSVSFLVDVLSREEIVCPDSISLQPQTLHLENLLAARARALATSSARCLGGVRLKRTQKFFEAVAISSTAAEKAASSGAAMWVALERVRN